MWPLAILMIVLVSWLLYRYVAPKGWKEWSRAGLIQAFIIELYAEMYGFPLTLYVLTGFFGVDIPLLHESGHLWATLLGLGPVGWMIEMILAFIVIFAGISLVIQGWREVYRARRENRFATEGPYAIVRHPQYLGIFVALFGQLIHWPTIPTLVLFPVIVWAYVRLARREERETTAHFGEAYREYQRRVPGFIPGGGQRRELFSRGAVHG
jgi:protein-S-isoprenylcysteine O-methyltransferase Ste14